MIIVATHIYEFKNKEHKREIYDSINSICDNPNILKVIVYLKRGLSIRLRHPKIEIKLIDMILSYDTIIDDLDTDFIISKVPFMFDSNIVSRIPSVDIGVYKSDVYEIIIGKGKGLDHVEGNFITPYIDNISVLDIQDIDLSEDNTVVELDKGIDNSAKIDITEIKEKRIKKIVEIEKIESEIRLYKPIEKDVTIKKTNTEVKKYTPSKKYKQSGKKIYKPGVRRVSR